MTIGHLFCDVSKWQGSMDWAKYDLKITAWCIENDAPPYVAVVIRAGSIDYTGPYTDYQFEPNIRGAQEHCDDIGFYWYFRPDRGLDVQAEYYVNLLRQYIPGTWVWGFDIHGAFFRVYGKGTKYRIWVDAEETGGHSAVYLEQQLWEFSLAIFMRAGNVTGVYTRQSWWDPNVALSSIHPWKNTKLWAARVKASLTSPWSDGYYKFRDWNEWTFWQWSGDKNGRGKEFGASSDDIDLNWSNGFFEVEDDSEEPGEVEEPMGEYSDLLTSIASDVVSIELGIGAIVDLMQEFLESGGSSGGGTDPEVSYIMVVVKEDPRVNARCVKGVNVSGYPIMQIYPRDTSATSERVQWNKGEFIMVQPDIVRADGGDRYYRVIPSEYADGLPQLYVPQESVSKIE